MHTIELPSDLNSPAMSVDEESKSEHSYQASDEFLIYDDELKRVAYKDELLTVYPLRSISKTDG